MLHLLELQDVGPAPQMRLELHPRLNLLTGDNSLGKTFMLEVAWWALTRTWAGQAALPSRKDSARPRIRYQTQGKSKTPEPVSSTFDFARQQWPLKAGRPPMPGLTLYAKADGGFSLWDPARNYWKGGGPHDARTPEPPPAYHFTAEQLWFGLTLNGKQECNGLLRDWVSWQVSYNLEQLQSAKGTIEEEVQRWEQGVHRLRRQHLERLAAQPPFGLLMEVLKELSPHAEQEPLVPGPKVQLSQYGTLEIPTLQMPYGLVPITLAAAGMKRILGLAYFLVWSFYQHVLESNARKQAPTDQLILLIDEVETHLHPQWQRKILPAILRAVKHLHPTVQVQILATTHAPLVLASVEPLFEADQDRLFLFELQKGQVSLRPVEFYKHGDAVDWLTSETFGLLQARSLPAQEAIMAALAFMRGDTASLPAKLQTQDQIHAALLQTLAGHDPFWAHWVGPSKKKGAQP